MQSVQVHSLSCCSSVRGKVALLIANQDYKNFPKLQTAEEDVKKLAVKLRRLGFNVLTLANLTLREMQEAQDIFCNHLLSQFACSSVDECYVASLSAPHYVQHNQFIHLAILPSSHGSSFSSPPQSKCVNSLMH